MKKMIQLAAGGRRQCSPARPSRDLTVVSFGGANKGKQKWRPSTSRLKKPPARKFWAWTTTAKWPRSKPWSKPAKVTWDVVEVESPEVLRGCEEAFTKNRPETDRRQGGPAGHRVGMRRGHFVWSTTIAYNADKLKTGPTSWADFWDVKNSRASAACARAPNTPWNSRCWLTA